jgi:excisionase family DNA binding protein
MQEADEVLRAEESARVLHVGPRAVFALARSGTLPGEKVGRAWRLVRTDMIVYVRGQKCSLQGGEGR